jgi:DNA polymerase-3 subunit delta
VDVGAFLKLPPSKQAGPVVVLAGDEPFFKEEALRALEKALGSPEKHERRISGGRKEIDIAPILDELHTGSLFSPVKLVIVRDAEAFAAAAGEAILAHARRAGARTTLVLDVGSLDKRTKAGKELDKAALVVDCKRLYSDPPPWAKNAAPHETPLVDWTVKRARAAGIAARPEVAHHLTQVTGNDLHEIAATLEKVSLSGAKELTPEHVEDLAGRTRRDDAFAVADAIGKRDAPRALAVLARLFERGLEDRRGGRISDAGAIGLIVFSRIHAKIGEIRRTVAYLARGGQRSRDAVAEALGIPPFLAERALAEAERFRGADVGALYRALLDADLGVKGAVPAGGARAALERLVLSLLNRPGAPAKIAATGGKAS